ncbi:aldo/keto reductase [Helicobacter winghamensis]|uniref:aldo/keto reductase n=1 Tax=Helicobacter winghamensis TaxID=157268 RepID=UPI0024330C8F|nr:aldo/keto reductase [Helicobacter winghamensis]
MQYITLNNGIKMPSIGLGTYGLQGQKGIGIIQNALQVGYKLIDTAQMYENEKEVGKALATQSLKDSNLHTNDLSRPLQRNELFITTKLSSNMSYKRAWQSIEQSLQNLGLEYVDLLLIHESYVNAKKMYKACEEAYRKGLTRAIGISNFYGRFLEDFLDSVRVKPVLNQVQAHIFFQQHTLQKFLESKNIHLQAWSPLACGRNGIFTNKTLQSIANTHHKSTAQIALKFLLDKGISIVPKASSLKRLQENLTLFDFSLTQQERDSITQLDTNKSLFGWDCY